MRTAVDDERGLVPPPGHGAGICMIGLTATHLPAALGLSQALRWPYRLEDWAFALSLGRGFAIEADGRLAGAALWWPYGERHASAGMVIVAPDAQRRGIGAALMDAILADTAGRTIALNSTREGLALYTRLGFAAYGKVHQHQAILPASPEATGAEAIRALRPDDLPAVRALDRAAVGMDRDALLHAVFAIADVRVIERDDAITGYGCVRRWGHGAVIGPIVARDAGDARALIAALAADHVGGFVRIDVTEACGLSPWLDAIGLPRVDTVVAMNLGLPPAASEGATLFALSNQSLG